MKRPLVWCGISVIAGAFLWRVGVVALIILLLLVFLSYTIQLKHPVYSHRFLFVSIGLLMLLYVGITDIAYNKTLQMFNGLSFVEGEGRIIGSEEAIDGCKYVLKPWYDENGLKQNFKLIIYSNDHVDVGDFVRFEGENLFIEPTYNEGGFDSQKYYKETMVIGRISGELDGLSRPSFSLRRGLQRLRNHHYSNIRLVLPEREADILSNMILGLNNVDGESRLLYQRTGVIHILAISGLHVSMIAFLLLGFMELIRPSLKINSWIVLVMLVAYTLYTGAHISTIRATVMMAIYLGHNIFYRKYDHHVALALAVMSMLLFNPFQLTSAGFLLSFTAVASIFYITPILPFGDVDNTLLKSVRVMVAIQVGITPLLIYFYNNVPLYSIFANLLILPVITFILSLGLIATIITSLSVTIGKVLMGSVFFLINYMNHVTSIISNMPFSSIMVGQINIYLIVSYYLMIILLVLKFKRLYVLALFLITITCIISFGYANHDTLEINMMDVGNGDALFAHYKGYTLLFDAGGQVGLSGDNVGSRVLYPYLAKKGIGEVNYAIISHSDFDHSYGIIELVEHVDIRNIVLPIAYKSYKDEQIDRIRSLAQSKGIQLIYVSQGDTLRIEDLTIDFLYPMLDMQVDDNNRNSIVSLVTLDEFDMLITGDIYQEDEEELVEAYGLRLGQVEVLKIPHHGSKTSSSEVFLNQIDPLISLISVGRHNIYGHPNGGVLARIESYSDAVYQTKESGQIKIIYKDGEIQVLPHIKENQ